MGMLRTNVYATIVAVLGVVAIMLAGSDSESMTMFFVSKILGVIFAVLAIAVGVKFVAMGKFGEVTE